MTETWDAGRLAEALGIKRSSVIKMSSAGFLPKPDGRNGRYVYWNDGTVRDILERRKQGTRGRAKRIEGFYTSADIVGMVPGMSPRYLYNQISEGAFPRAVKNVGRINYWAAEDVGPLLEGLRLRIAGAHQPTTGLSIKVDPDCVYNCAGIARMVPYLSRRTLLGMVERGEFPQPVRIMCNNGYHRLMWYGRDISGRIAELRERYADLAREAWFSRDICGLFGLDNATQLANAVSGGRIPEHDGYLFTRRYWLKSSVTAWLEKYAGKRVGVYVPDGILAVADPVAVHVRAVRKATDGLLARAIGRARQNAAYYESVAAELEREQGRRNAKKA